MRQKYIHQPLNISSDWTIVRNEFYDIDPKENVPDDDKEIYIYCQQDMLYITKAGYHLDLGWYGYDDLTAPYAGYCIHLFRGNNWNDGELVGKYFSKNKQAIVNKINELIELVDLETFDSLTGYRVDENDPTNMKTFEDLDNYSAK